MFITLSRSQWTVLAVVILIVLPVILGLVFLPTIQMWYAREVIGPEVQREFGFTADIHSVTVGKEQWRVFIITAVRTGGTLEKAGFHTGDIPVGYYQGFELGFYNALLRSKKGQTTDIRVVHVSDLPRSDWRTRERKITLSGRK